MISEDVVSEQLGTYGFLLARRTFCHWVTVDVFAGHLLSGTDSSSVHLK